MAAAWLDALMLNEVNADSKELKLAESVIDRRGKHSDVDLIDRKAKSAERIGEMLVKAQERGAPDALIQSFEARLAELNG
jgi:hypothetical protein